jgi:hypothetical protein
MKKILFIGVIYLFCTSSSFCQKKQAWASAKEKNTIYSYENFLEMYPKCSFSDSARILLKPLKEAQLAKERQFINLVKENSNNIKIGMSYNQADLLLKFSDCDCLGSYKNSSYQNYVGKIVIDQQLLLANYLYLKFENNILKGFHILQDTLVSSFNPDKNIQSEIMDNSNTGCKYVGTWRLVVIGFEKTIIDVRDNFFIETAEGFNWCPDKFGRNCESFIKVNENTYKKKGNEITLIFTSDNEFLWEGENFKGIRISPLVN